jgi:hypothetical protein
MTFFDEKLSFRAQKQQQLLFPRKLDGLTSSLGFECGTLLHIRDQ